MQRYNHARKPLVAKRNQHPPADHRLMVGNLVGKCHVQWDWQSYITEGGHGLLIVREEAVRRRVRPWHQLSDFGAEIIQVSLLLPAVSIPDISSPSANLSRL